MSKESEPIHSRRALRRAQDSPEQPGNEHIDASLPPAPAPVLAEVPRRPSTGPTGIADSESENSETAGGEAHLGQRRRRAADAPVDAPPKGSPREPSPSPRERSSQTRARDRATLRAYKELSDPATAAVPILPSRRAMRMAQGDAERAPLTDLNSVVRDPSGLAAEGRGPADRPAGSAIPPGTPSSLPRVHPADAPAGASPSVPAGHHSGAAYDAAPFTGPMSVQDALAARSSLVEDVKEQISQLPAAVAEDPLQVDLEVLAQQRALAERAAILNQRAQAKERLAQASANTRPSTNDPTTAHNLAMVTPLEFIRVPGVDQPVMRPPGTSYVPVVTRQTPRSRPADGQQRPAARTGAAGRPAPAGERTVPGDRTDAPRNGNATSSRRPVAPGDRTAAPADLNRSSAPEDNSAASAGQTPPASWTATPARRTVAPADRPAPRQGRTAPPANRAAAWPAVGPFSGPADTAGATRQTPAGPPSSAPGTPTPGSRSAQSGQRSEQGDRAQNPSRASTLKRAEAVARGVRSGHNASAAQAAQAAPAASTRPRTGASSPSRPNTGRTSAPRAGATRANSARVAAGRAAAGQSVPAVRTHAPSQPYEPAEMPPLPAGNAHGLEPLDAVTAGLGRVQRNRLIQWGAIIIGGVALIAGLSMLIIGLAH